MQIRRNIGFFMGIFTADNGTSEIEIKRSRFLGAVKKAESEQAARDFISAIKKQNSLAKHNCYAYIVIDDGQERVKYSDDGEPQGTAGLPILNVLKAKNLKNVACVVTRYFGGIKLGAGGLVRAYTDAAATAVSRAEKKELLECAVFKIDFSYENYKKFANFSLPERCIVEKPEYGEKVSLTVVLSKALSDEFLNKFNDFFLKRQPISRLSDVWREFAV